MHREKLVQREDSVMAENEQRRTSVGERTGILSVPSSATKQSPLPTHLLFSVVSVLICPPLGILAVIQALKVDKALKLNDLECAERASALAAKYSLAGVMLGTHLGCLIGTCVICYLYQHH